MGTTETTDDRTPKGGAPYRRVVVIVLDGVGIGELPDAAAYGDAGTNTLGHLAAAVGGLRLPALEALGLGDIATLDGVAENDTPAAFFGKMAERSGPSTTRAAVPAAC
jgi:phosphopentomutase